MLVKKSKSLLRGLAAAALVCCASAHAELVTNGGFETGDFTGWTPSVVLAYDGVDTTVPHSGSYAAYFGNAKPDVSTISQTLNTVAGGIYHLTYALKNEGSDPTTPNNAFGLSWDGGSVAAATQTNMADFDYTVFDYVLTASGTATDLSFMFSQDPLGIFAFWDFDSVSVTENIPEPGSFALAALAGVLALGVSNRRRQVSGLRDMPVVG